MNSSAMADAWRLSPDRFFDPDPSVRNLARQLYGTVANEPIISPHGHIDIRLLSDPDAAYGSPTELLIVPDHYVFRMLHSRGISLEALGIPTPGGMELREGVSAGPGAGEAGNRKVWQLFSENFYLFRGTPTGIWLAHELTEVFGVKKKLSGETAQEIYDQIADCLTSPEFSPRRLYERMNIAVLCTTDPAWDRLEQHQALRASDWKADVRPTFRPDGVVNLDFPGWLDNIHKLEQASGIEIGSYKAFIQALELQRAYFKKMGATATDHAALTPFTQELTADQAETIFQRALHGQSQQGCDCNPGDSERFTGHMLMEMARMSIEDGLVMQLHPGSLRDYDRAFFERFGRDKGADIPIAHEFTRSLQPLLSKYGRDARLRLILFTLDEATYARDLAPLAGFYPSLLIGPPWWFYDSLNGMRRYFDLIVETAGLYNTAGFNDDTRAFPSIPARHDVWRRASANWLANLVLRGVIDEQDASQMIHELSTGLARKAYRLDQTPELMP